MNADDLPPDPGRNLALELVRATEAAAIAAARFMGRGDKERVDQAAVDAMRPVLRSVAMDGIVVIGEGEKDEAPMLYNGERVGSGVPPEVDVDHHGGGDGRAHHAPRRPEGERCHHGSGDRRVLERVAVDAQRREVTALGSPARHDGDPTPIPVLSDLACA